MAEPFLGELKLISFNFPPKGWTFCNGQFLPINQNQALFSLLGTVYGGNGQTTFALPNLQGKVPTSMGGGLTLGETGGETAHTVTLGELPAHNHGPTQASTDTADVIKPGLHIFGTTAGNLTLYAPPQNVVPMASATCTTAGGSQPHENRQPFLVLNWIIALQGIFPSQN